MVMYSDIVEINLVYMLLYMNYIQAALWFLRCVSISLYMRHILTTCNTCSSLDGLLPATRQKNGAAALCQSRTDGELKPSTNETSSREGGRSHHGTCDLFIHI